MSVMEAPQVVEASPTAQPKSNRVKLLAFLAIGVLLLAAAAFFVPPLLKGDTADTAAPIAKGKPRSKPADAAVTPTAKKPVRKAAKAPVALKVRDPFKVLYVEPAAAAAGSGTSGAASAPRIPGQAPAAPVGAAPGTTTVVTAPTGTTAGTTTTTTTTGATGATGAAGTTGATGATGATGSTGGTTAVTTIKVSLVAVGTSNGKLRASTTVNGTIYTPAVGDIFGKVYKLISVEGSCGTFLFGDQKFGLCVGQYIVH